MDAERAADERGTHFSHELEPSYFSGLVSETYNPAKNRYEKRRGARNEPLDTWVYSFAAAHHPELRLHRMRAVDWDARETQLRAALQAPVQPVPEIPAPQTVLEPSPPPLPTRTAQRRRPAAGRLGW